VGRQGGVRLCGRISECSRRRRGRWNGPFRDMEGGREGGREGEREGGRESLPRSAALAPCRAGESERARVCVVSMCFDPLACIGVCYLAGAAFQPAVHDGLPPDAG
jgi:hypothetical protein